MIVGSARQAMPLWLGDDRKWRGMVASVSGCDWDSSRHHLDQGDGSFCISSQRPAVAVNYLHQGWAWVLGLKGESNSVQRSDSVN